MRRYLLWIGLGITLGLVLVAAIFFTRPYTFHGSVIQDAYTAPDFLLPDDRGDTFQLSQQRGHLVLIFFGYTSCPDVCPTTLSQMKQLYKALGQDASKVEVVFITVDPERDTPQQVSQYASTFNPNFVGLSGSEEQLAPIWKSYGVYRKLNKTSPGDVRYSVDHSSSVYVVDTQGNLRMTFSFGTPTDQILSDIKQLLRRG